MKKIDAIFFDLDGTLVDSREDIVRAVNYTLKEAGLPDKTHHEIISYVGTGVKDLIIKSLGDKDREEADRYVSVFAEYFREHHSDNSRLYPNVKDILELYKKKKLVVVTNRRVEMTAGTLEKLGIDKYFDKVIGADDENCRKPEACPVNKALSGVAAEAGSSLMVGDMVFDISAGKAAGILTCAVTYGLGKRRDLEEAGPDYLIDDMAELKAIIK